MSDLNEFLALMASAKKTDPVARKTAQIKENAKESLADLFGQLSEAKKQDPKQQLISKVKESVKSDLNNLFAQLAQAESPVTIAENAEEHINDLVEVVQAIESHEIKEEVLIEVAPEEPKTNVEKYTETLSKEPPSFQQPDVPKVSPEVKSITEKLKFLEQWVAKISAAGPGSGEVNLRWLDDVDRSTIGDGKYLNYNATTKKFQFSTISGGGVPQVQSNWTETDNTVPSYIQNKPTLFSGSYTDLTGKPNSIHWINPSPSPSTNWRTTFSANANDATIVFNEGLPGIGSVYTWTFDKDSITFPDNTQQTTAWTGTYSYNNLTDKPTLFSGSYTDLTNKPTIPSLTGYATESFVNTAISNVVGAAPDALNTLKEISDALADDDSAITALTNSVAGKVSLTGSYANPQWITSLAYGKLTDAPTNVSSFTNDAGYLSTVSWSQVTNKPDGILTINDTNVVSNDMLINENVTVGSTAIALGQTVTSLTGLQRVAIAGGATTNNNSAIDKSIDIGTRGQLFDDGNLHVHTSSGPIWINSLDGGDIRLGMQTNSGKSNVVVDTTTNGHSFFTKVQSGFNVNEPSVAMDNLNVRLRNTSGSLLVTECSAVSGSFSAYVTIVTNKAGVAMVGDTNSNGITFSAGTWSSINASQSVSAGGDTQIFHVIDNTNNRIYRVTAIHCSGIKGGYISIERMC